MNSAHVTRRIAQASGIVMASVLASRVLGFLRDWTVAHQIGSNAVTDAYYAAFTLPDFLNYLVAGGSLSITFIPVFTKFVAMRWYVPGLAQLPNNSAAVLLTAAGSNCPTMTIWPCDAP